MQGTDMPRETIEKAEETDTVVTAKYAENKEARETIGKLRI